MISLLKMILCFYVLILCIGALSAVFRFFLDVWRWHDKEVKEEIHCSIDDVVNDIMENTENTDEKGVTVDVSNIDVVTEVYAGRYGESDTPVI